MLTSFNDALTFFNAVLDITLGVPAIQSPRFAFALAVAGFGLIYLGGLEFSIRELIQGAKASFGSLLLMTLLIGLMGLLFGAAYGYLFVALIRTGEGYYIGEFFRSRRPHLFVGFIVAVLTLSGSIAITQWTLPIVVQSIWAAVSVFLSIVGVVHNKNAALSLANLPARGKALFVAGLTSILVAAYLYVPSNPGLSFGYSLLLPTGIAISLGCWPIVECLDSKKPREHCKHVRLRHLSLSCFVAVPLLAATLGFSVLYGCHLANRPSMNDYEGQYHYWQHAGRGEEHLAWAREDLSKKTLDYENMPLVEVFKLLEIPAAFTGLGTVSGVVLFGMSWSRRRES